MKKWALIIFLLFLVGSIGFLGWYFNSRGKSDETKVKLEKVERGDISKKTVATGSIIPEKEVAIIPRVSGVIDAIYVKAGDQVKVGQEIAKIKLVPDAMTINNAETQVRNAELSVQRAERELQRQKQVSQSGQDVQQASIALRESEKELARQKALFDDGIISEQAYNQFSADVELKRAALDIASTGADRTLDTYQADLDLQRSQLRSAKNNLSLLKEGATKKSGGASNVIVSTVDGTVLSVPLKEGASVIESNTFNAGSTIALVANMKSMIFAGKIDESEAGKIREGMDIELTIGALPDKKYKAKLYYVSPKGTMQEGTIKFDIEAKVQLKEGDFIRAGYSANADIEVDRKENVLVISEAALDFAGDTTFVKIKKGEGEYERSQIKTGLSDGLKIEVISGLSEGNEVKLN